MRNLLKLPHCCTLCLNDVETWITDLTFSKIFQTSSWIGTSLPQLALQWLQQHNTKSWFETGSERENQHQGVMQDMPGEEGAGKNWEC